MYRDGSLMRQFVFILSLIAAIIVGPMANAQDRAWVQIEAQQTLTQAQERARAYASAFPDVAGFQMRSGWYAIVLGPYAPEDALQRLAQLRRDNLIPNDSFIAGGADFQQAFWPVGQDPSQAPLGAITQTTLPNEAPTEAAPTEAAPTEAVQNDAIASAEPAPPLPAAVTLPDETPAEARRSEAALNRAERMALQESLAWFGFYTSAIDGAFGPGTRNSMSEWQAAMGHEPTGIMTTAQRSQIVADRERIVAELGLELITEEEAGIEISLPMTLVEFDHYEPPFVHFSSRGDSGFRVVLISEPGDRSTLFGLYDILQTLAVVPPEGDRNRGDRSFTIEAANTQVASYSYAELSGGLIKGYMLIWTPEQADKAGRALSAMQASFKPVGKRALDPGLISLDDAQRRSLLAGMEVRRPRLSRTGFFVSGNGAVITTIEAVQSCSRITLNRETETSITATDEATGLALLTPKQALAPRVIAGLELTPPRIGTEIAVSGFSYEDALPSPTLTFGALEDTKGLAGEPGINRLSLTALPGDAGGPVIDGTGAVLGMLMTPQADTGRVLPKEVAFLATSAQVSALMTRAGLVPQPAKRDGALAPEDLTDLANAMTVLVSCWE